MGRTRVRELEPVITGMGIVTPIGVGVEAFWRAAMAGTQGARPVQLQRPTQLRYTTGCQLDDALLPPGAHPDGTTRASALGSYAAAEALRHARREPGHVDVVFVGTTMGDLPAIEDQLLDDDASRVTGLSSRSFGERIAAAVGVTAPAFTLGTSCSAGNHAIFRAAELVRAGRARCVLAGGADAFSTLAFIGFARMRAMAPLLCTPFARDRKGILLGEGAAFLVIEPRAAAAERDTPIHAAIAGVGLSCDAHHISTPAPNGRGAIAAMTAALDDAAIEPGEVDFVAAHGTGTPHNDLAESRACATVFGRHRPYVSSVKALIGHTLGAGSAVQAVACALSFRDQRVVPAWNVEEQDPDCDVSLPLPGRAVDRSLRVAISNGFAFGGNNSCLVLRSLT